MERLQVVTKAVCPPHASQLYVVVQVDDTGGVTIWKGCIHCPNAAVLNPVRESDKVEKNGKDKPT